MPRPLVRTAILETAEAGHLLEYLYDDGENDEVLVCAGHGGQIEAGTAAQAIELATRVPSASCWARLGFDDGADAFDRYHDASSAIDPDECPLLGEIADRGFATVVSLHGLGDEGIIVGGGVDDSRKARVAARLDDAVAVEVRTVSDGPYAGTSPNNFVNWLAADGVGGLQLEQGLSVRTGGDDAVVDVLADLVENGSI